MAYQGGGGAPGNGYWPQDIAPNGYRQDDIRQPILPRGPPQQYSSSVNGQTGHWSSNYQGHNGMPPAASSNLPYAQAPAHQQYQQSQFISPAQLFQQPSPQPRVSQLPRTPSLKRKPSDISSKSMAGIEASLDTQSQPDNVMLLVSLAEEYFEEAHKLAPSVAHSMATPYIDAYQRLIATGLTCLDAALKRERMTPRIEAQIRLRYAGVLLEETENAEEAETTLILGIALCERNHYLDLRYAMQYLLAQFTAKKNIKASIKAMDAHISEAELYQHVPWVYAFRFLRASLVLGSSTSFDNKAAVQNLQAIARLAQKQNDNAIHLTASLMEAMTYMRSTVSDALEHMQRSIAAAWSHQFDPECSIPQLQCLTHMIDVICSIRQGQHVLMREKLKHMRDAMDSINESKSWTSMTDAVAIPIRRTAKSSQIVSPETRMILGIGDNGGDSLMMSFLSQRDATAISFLIGGFVLQQGSTAPERLSAAKYLQEGISRLETDGSQAFTSSSRLPDILSTRLWRGHTICYSRIYLAFYYASLAEWVHVGRIISELRNLFQRQQMPPASTPGNLIMYLTAIYHQGVGELEQALRLFQNERFDLETHRKHTSHNSSDLLDQDLAILAALNSLWIRQHPRFQNIEDNAALLEKLTPFCENHMSNDMRAAFSLVLATVKTQPPAPMIQLKQNMNVALGRAQKTKNYQILSITLSVMCSKFFENIMGAQAEKSAMAASIQSRSSGNPLWMNVADGMLSKCYELQGKALESKQTMDFALQSAQKVLPGIQEY